MEDGRWKMEDGRWEMGDGRFRLQRGTASPLEDDKILFIDVKDGNGRLVGWAQRSQIGLR
ncbi:MAG: hypothetical protein ACI957_004005 [Verrucomicrobiales bacterium]|jgi:hypothetical protein